MPWRAVAGISTSSMLHPLRWAHHGSAIDTPGKRLTQNAPLSISNTTLPARHDWWRASSEQRDRSPKCRPLHTAQQPALQETNIGWWSCMLQQHAQHPGCVQLYPVIQAKPNKLLDFTLGPQHTAFQRLHHTRAQILEARHLGNLLTITNGRTHVSTAAAAAAAFRQVPNVESFELLPRLRVWGVSVPELLRAVRS